MSTNNLSGANRQTAAKALGHLAPAASDIAACSPLGIIPNIYSAPMGLPLYWGDEVSGVLPDAVRAYYTRLVDGVPELTEAQLALLWDYVSHHINAPCWDVNCADAMKADLAALRACALLRGDLQDLRDYCHAAAEIELDPF